MGPRVSSNNMVDKGKSEDGLRGSFGPQSGTGFTAYGGKPEGFHTRTMSVGERPSVQRKDYQSKTLTKSEWKDHRAKGLCFKCDEKFTIAHQCKNQELHILLAFDNEVEGKEHGKRRPYRRQLGWKGQRQLNSHLTLWWGLLFQVR